MAIFVQAAFVIVFGLFSTGLLFPAECLRSTLVSFKAGSADVSTTLGCFGQAIGSESF